MNISIVIPNYNGARLLRKNLPKVFDALKYYNQKNDFQGEIIIIDDCSEDESVEEIKYQISHLRASFAEVATKGEQGFGGQAKIKSRSLELKFKKNEKNLGFASTVNRGVKESKGEVVVLLNTDVRPEIDFLIPLLSHFKDEKLFSVGCIDKNIEDGKLVFRGRGLGRWEKGFLVHSRGEVNKTNTLWVSGGSGAFRKSIWDKLGGFNHLYNPFYWEDIDLSYRALKSGYKILFDPNSIVIHEHEEGAIKNIYSSIRVKTIAYRNQFMFVWINVSDMDILLSHIFWLPYHFFRMLVLRDWAYYKGFVMALKNFYKVMNSRNKVQKDFIVKDRQVCHNT